jgi:hypothetical protein
MDEIKHKKSRNINRKGNNSWLLKYAHKSSSSLAHEKKYNFKFHQYRLSLKVFVGKSPQ